MTNPRDCLLFLDKLILFAGRKQTGKINTSRESLCNIEGSIHISMLCMYSICLTHVARLWHCLKHWELRSIAVMGYVQSNATDYSMPV